MIGKIKTITIFVLAFLLVNQILLKKEAKEKVKENYTVNIVESEMILPIRDKVCTVQYVCTENQEEMLVKTTSSYLQSRYHIDEVKSLLERYCAQHSIRIEWDCKEMTETQKKIFYGKNI